MSKIRKKYDELKQNRNSNMLYLFKSGIFYISLEDDAKKLSELFKFKLTNLNDSTVKCGFPESKLDFYTNILKECSVEFEIIDFKQDIIKNTDTYITDKKCQKIINNIKELNMDNISYKKAFDLLVKFNKELNNEN